MKIAAGAPHLARRSALSGLADQIQMSMGQCDRGSRLTANGQFALVILGPMQSAIPMINRTVPR